MNATILSTDDPAWSAGVRALRHDFYHLPAYVALSGTVDGGEAVALSVVDSDRHMLLPLILRDIDATGLRDATSPYGYPGPITDGSNEDGFLTDALLAGCDALRAQGIVTLFVRLHPILNASPPERIGTVVAHGETVSVDLSQPETTLWSETRRDHRRDIERAIERGFTARMDDDLDRFDDFVRLYRVTMDRLSAASYYRFDDDYFEKLRAALGDRLHLCLVEHDGIVASASLWVVTDGIVQYHLSGSDQAFADAKPSKLMVHFARVWAQEHGARILHLGGGLGGRDDSLMAFKAGFSPLRQPFRTLRVVLDGPAYERLVRSRDAASDPDDIAGFFPAYRRS